MRNSRYLNSKLETTIRKVTDTLIPQWADDSLNLRCHADRYFLAARDEAFKSNFHNARIGCVLVYKRNIIGYGHNQLKTDPAQSRYNIKYRKFTRLPDFSKTCGHIIHAEIDALKSVVYPVAQQINWSRVDVYIFRIAPGLDGYAGLSLPCEACAHALADAGIRHIYYTTGRIDTPFGHADL